jgi:hypothetical protein
MKSLNNGDWSQSIFNIIMGVRIMDFFLTYDLIIVTKCHGSRSCVTEGQVKQSSPGKESINKCYSVFILFNYSGKVM